LALSLALEPGFTHSWGSQTHKVHVIIVIVVTSLCHQCLLSQAVPKKKKESGRKVLAKILTQILADCKKADGLTKIWWEVFNVRFPCCSRRNIDIDAHKSSLCPFSCHQSQFLTASQKSGVRYSNVCVRACVRACVCVCRCVCVCVCVCYPVLSVTTKLYTSHLPGASHAVCFRNNNETMCFCSRP